MKIVITGAMGVGKTTLAKMLGEKTGIDILPEVARQMIAEGYKIDYEVTEDTEREILHRQTLLEAGEEDFIADRGIMDILAYSTIMFGGDEELGIEPNYELLNYINDWYSRAEYDVIFYLPPEFPIEDDGIRSTDIEFQNQVDEAIKEILSSGAFKWYTLTGGREKRLKSALKHLTSVK